MLQVVFKVDLNVDYGCVSGLGYEKSEKRMPLFSL